MQEPETRYHSFNIFTYLWYWLISRRPVFILNFGLIIGLLFGLALALIILDSDQNSEYNSSDASDIMPVLLPQQSMIPEYSTPPAVMADDTPTADKSQQDVANNDQDNSKPEKISFRIRIKDAKSLPQQLAKHGMAAPEIKEIAALISKKLTEQNYKNDKVLSVNMERGQWKSYPSLTKATLYFSTERAMDITPKKDGGFSTAMRAVKIERKVSNIISPVKTSFLQAGHDAGLPQDTLHELIQAFSYDIDFQRDIQPNDKLQILYERFYTDDGTPVRSGGIIYAALIQRDETTELYRFKQDDGSYGYFREDGRSIKRSMLRTPMDGARISSGFGMRTHPVLGYSRMHRGVDFAAPTGTPIFAAGDGVVEMASRNGGYGNYVRIKHGSGYSSAYGHMSRFARNIRPGAKVRQGQIIGYVGSTGLATGPHLHYEILANNVQVNPVQVRFMASDKLGGKSLAAFKREVREVASMLSSLPKATQVASR